MGANPAALEAPHQLGESVDVHRLVEAVVHRLTHEGVVGDLHRPRRVLLAGGEAREDGGHEVVGLHALDRGRVAPAAPHAEHRQGAVQVPAPAGGEER